MTSRRYIYGFAIFLVLLLMTSSVNSTERDLIEPLRDYAREVAGEFDQIPNERKQLLDSMVSSMRKLREDHQTVKLTFICTHNSRRSHLGQVWAQTAAAYYGISSVETFSGGTESTACNIRTVRALRRAGFSVVCEKNGTNPVYLIQNSEVAEPFRAFSKVYDKDGNPTEAYLAVMCCDDADRNCPMVRGASDRVALSYVDPKVADDTLEESECYDERCRQIAREMFYVMSRFAEPTP